MTLCCGERPARSRSTPVEGSGRSPSAGTLRTSDGASAREYVSCSQRAIDGDTVITASACRTPRVSESRSTSGASSRSWRMLRWRHSSWESYTIPTRRRESARTAIAGTSVLPSLAWTTSGEKRSAERVALTQ